MYSKIKLLFLILFLFLLSPSKVNAAFSFSIDNVTPVSVDSKETELIVNLTLTDLPSGDNYFRVGFKEGNTYVGYIKNNNGDWIKLRSLSDGCIDYFKISESATSLILNLKIGSDIEVSNGSIPLKAHRYTSSCATNTGSNEYPITINLPTPTPSPTPTQSPTSQPTNAPTTAPTAVPTVKPAPTKSPSPKPTASPTPSDEPEETDEPTEILGMSTDNDKTITPESRVAGNSTEKKSPILAIIFVILGTGCLGYVGYLIYNGRHVKTSDTS